MLWLISVVHRLFTLLQQLFSDVYYVFKNKPPHLLYRDFIDNLVCTVLVCVQLFYNGDSLCP